MSNTVGMFADAVTQDFAARLFIVRSEAEPRREVISRRELGDIGANLGEDDLDGGGGVAINFEQVHASDTAEMRLRGFRRGIFAVGCWTWIYGCRG